MIKLSVSDIVSTGINNRQEFDKEETRRLAESLVTHGLLEPLVVREKNDAGEYELVAGERRLRAIKLIREQDANKFKQIDCKVVKGNRFFASECSMIENIQRADLQPMEIAHGLAEMRNCGLSQADIASKLGKKQAWVSQYLGLLKEEPEVQKLVEDGKASVGTVRDLKTVPAERRQEAIESIRERKTTIGRGPRVSKTVAKSEDKIKIKLQHTAAEVEKTVTGLRGTAKKFKLPEPSDPTRTILESAYVAGAADAMDWVLGNNNKF